MIKRVIKVWEEYARVIVFLQLKSVRGDRAIRDTGKKLHLSALLCGKNVYRYLFLFKEKN